MMFSERGTSTARSTHTSDTWKHPNKNSHRRVYRTKMKGIVKYRDRISVMTYEDDNVD